MVAVSVKRSIAIANIMTLKHNDMNFVLCPKQGPIESGVLNRVGILGFFFCSKQSQGL